MNLASRMDERVTIQAEARTPNGQGGFTTTWADVASVWAEIIGLSGEESIEAAIERSSARYRVTIRKRSDVTPRHRLDWNGTKLDVRSVLPDPRNSRGALVLICEAGLNREN